MTKRYVEMKDKNNVPVYEGDTLSFGVKELAKRTSKIGQFLSAMNPEDLTGELTLLETYPEVKINFSLKFKKASGEYLKNKDFASFFKIEESKEDSDSDYVLNNKDAMFSRYLFGVISSEMEIISDVEGAREEFVNNDAFRYKVGNEYYKLETVILFERNEYLEETFKKEESLIAEGEYTHFGATVKKLENGFVSAVRFYFSDKKGNPSCERKTSKIKDEFEDICYKMSDECEEKERKASQEKRNKIIDIKDSETLSQSEKEQQIELVKKEFEEKQKEIYKGLKEYSKANKVWETKLYDDLIISLDNDTSLRFIAKLMEDNKYQIIEK